MTTESDFDRAQRILGHEMAALEKIAGLVNPEVWPRGDSINTPEDLSETQINRLVEANELPNLRVVRSTVLVEVDAGIMLAALVDGLAKHGLTVEFGANGRLHVRENHIGKFNREEWERRFNQRAQRVGEYAAQCKNGTAL